MTATEGLLASQNGPAGSVYTSSAANAAVGSPHKYEISDVAISFGQEYYTMMSYDPESLHCFYKKHSTALHCSDTEKDAIVCVGLEQIHQSITSMGYKGARVIVANIDCQQTLNGGILIFVLGEFHWPHGIVRKFAQTLVLAEQPGGYFILNDILRVLEEGSRAVTEKQVTPAEASPAMNESTTPPTTISVSGNVSHASITEESVLTKDSPTTPTNTRGDDTSTEIAKPVPEKSLSKNKNTEGNNQKTVKKTVKTAASASSSLQTLKQDLSETKDVNTPSSWAKLAAVQQNRWGSGVVAESKGPVASIPIEGDSKRSNNSSAGSKNFKTGGTPHTNTNQEAPATGDKTAGFRDRRNLNDFDVSKSIYAHGIVVPADATSIRKIFEQFGAIKTFDFVRTRGIAFIEFETSSAQVAALKASLVWNDAPIIVETRRGPRRDRDPAQEKGPDSGSRRVYSRRANTSTSATERA